jgi:hypothetical protein
MLQGQAYHRDLRDVVWANRDSNGAIEKHILDRVEKELRGEPSIRPAAGQ